MIACRVLLLLLLAQAAPTATSTRPAAPLDLTTPKAAARSLFLAVAAGDREGVRSVLHADDAAQRELTAAMADFIINGKRLGDAAREQFGKAGDPIGRGMLDPNDLTRIDAASVNETGDTATIDLTDAGRSRAMTFRRLNGQWRLVVTDFAAAAPANIVKQTKLVHMMADAIGESARDLGAGKYKTPDEAIGAIQKRLHEVMLTFTRPATTRSTTEPTTRPSH